MIARQNDTAEDLQFQMVADLAEYDLLKRAKIELKPFEYALLSHYVMTYGMDGVITEALPVTAKANKMSLNKTRDARQALVDAGYISLQVFDLSDYRNGQTPVVLIEDRCEGTSEKMQGTSNMMYATQRVAEFLRLVPRQAPSDLMDGGTSKTVGKRVKDSRDKDTNISPPNGVLVGASQPTPQRPRDTWYDFIFDTWGYTGSLNGEMRKMLQGRSTHPSFKAGNLPDHVQLTPEDGYEWAAWYRQTALRGDPMLNMLEDRMKIASSIEQWYVQGKPKVGAVALPINPKDMTASQALSHLRIRNIRQ